MDGHATLRTLVQALGAAGLEPKEARLYIELWTRGPLRASEAAGHARLNRTEAYRKLEAMMRAGHVTATFARPTLYDAIEPAQLFDDAIRQHAARGIALAEAQAAAEEALGRLRREHTGASDRPSYRMLHSRRTIYGVVETMLRRARIGQSLVTTYFAPRNATPANKALGTTQERAAAGLPMRLLFVESPGLLARLGPLLARPNVEVRFFEPEAPLRMTIVDEQEVLVWLHTDPSPELDAAGDAAMWTNAPEFVTAQRSLYESLWAGARPARPPPEGGDEG